MSFWAVVALVFFVLYWRERQQKHYLADQKRRLIARVTDLERVIYPTAPAPDSPVNDSRELQDLRERIKVLERIATDDNSIDARESARISAEIEALRALPAAKEE
jgi:nicotinic acid mononucleotide adenylyltransferase